MIRDAYDTTLIIWGIAWIIAGTLMMYLIVRHLSQESKRADAGRSIESPPAATALPEETRVAAGR